jgi:hypothetical protein
MKLYFPTTSLNFNNFFSTESISPKIFYERRAYGINELHQTELGKDERFITLFRQIPYFELIDDNKSEYEQYPIIIELVVSDNDDNFIKLDENIYCTYKTIYFEKERIKVIFFTEEHKKIILAKAKISNEVKLINKYLDDFKVLKADVRDALVHYKLNNIKYPSINPDVMETEIKKDKIFNYFKGFYILYVFKRFFYEYNQFKGKYDMNINRYDLIRKSLINDDIDNSAYSYMIGKQLRLLDDFQNEYLKELDARHENLINRIKSCSIDNSNKIIITSGTNTDNEEKYIFEVLINTILSNHKSKPGNVEHNEIFCLLENIVGIFKETVRNQDYIHDINLVVNRVIHRDYSIDVGNIYSDVLKNFYAFALKCGNIDEFINFLNIKKMRNEYLAYAYYGAYYGFAGISKILTHEYYNGYNVFLEIIDTNLINIRKHINLNVEAESYQANKNNKGNQIEREIHILLKKLIEAKRLHAYVKKSKVKINGSDKSLEGSIEFNALDRDNENSDISVVYLTGSKKYIVQVKHKNNITEKEKNDFKKILDELNLEENIGKGSYPIYNYYSESNGKKENLSKQEKEEFLKLLQRLLLK